jgi:hypothetical protein
MKYNDYRYKIKSGDLISWKNNDWKSIGGLLSQIVRIWERSEYSHVGTAIVLYGRLFVIEVVEPHVRLVPLSNRLPFYWTPINAPWKTSTEFKAMALVGAPQQKYSILEAIHGAVGLKDPGKDNLWQCAELSWYLADCDGIDLGKDIYPSAIVKEAQKRGSTTYLEA